MQLERLALVLRPRNGWEAIDLGLRMAVRWAGPLYRSWLSLVLPFLLLVYSVTAFGFDIGGWGLFVIWWLKPAYDRIALYVLSHCVFGERPSVRQTLRAMPGIWRHSNLLRALLWGRFDFWRSLRMPIDQLEGLHGREARDRRRLITQRVGNAGLCLTAVFPWLESLLTFALLSSAVLVLVPLDVLVSDNLYELFIGPDAQLIAHVSNFVWLLSFLLLEPLYVAGGFALYLKRRSDLEAWDVEMQFRRLADEHAERERQSRTPSSADNVSRIAVLALCALLSLTTFAPPAGAQTTPVDQREQAAGQADKAIQQVFNQPEFGKEVKYKSWQLKEGNLKNKEPSDPSAPSKFVTWIAENIATIMRAIAWLGLAVVVYLLVRLVIRHFGDWTSPNKVYIPPAEIAGLDIRPESLPKDIAGEAQQLADAGQLRAALSLLFRGALSVLAHRDQVPFTCGDTEQECLIRVRQHAQPTADYFAALTGCWQRLAYAHLSINSAEVKQLCQTWPRYFMGGQGE